MNGIFISELCKEQEISMVMSNGIEYDYRILDIYTDGIKVIKIGTGNVKLLVPFASIKYIRVKSEDVL